jgi:hypothetical protein
MMDHMFSGASAFEGHGLRDWQTSRVGSLYKTFYNTSSFYGDLSAWDVSSTTRIESTFENSRVYNGRIGGWDVRSLAKTSRAFSGATYFNGDVGSWDMSRVVSTHSMFGNTSAFNARVDGWDVSSVTHLISMFENAKASAADDSTCPLPPRHINTPAILRRSTRTSRRGMCWRSRTSRACSSAPAASRSATSGRWAAPGGACRPSRHAFCQLLMCRSCACMLTPRVGLRLLSSWKKSDYKNWASLGGSRCGDPSAPAAPAPVAAGASGGMSGREVFEVVLLVCVALAASVVRERPSDLRPQHRSTAPPLLFSGRRQVLGGSAQAARRDGQRARTYPPVHPMCSLNRCLQRRALLLQARSFSELSEPNTNTFGMVSGAGGAFTPPTSPSSRVQVM